MAVYKPNNFYPRLQEVDLTKQNGNIFSCQVNTDGSFINGADLKIYSEENVLLYHNLYDFSEYPVPDGEFLGMNVLPYRVHCEKYNGLDLTNEDDKIFILSDVSFINLNPDIAFDERKDYCPYNFFNLRFKDSISFGIKFIINAKEYVYPFSIVSDNTHFYKDIEDENTEIINSIYNGIELIEGNKYNIYIDIEQLDLSIFKELNNDVLPETYICLLNNKDYYWDVQLYEHKFGSEDYKKNNEGTLLAEGYITGSTKNVLWFDMNKQSNEVFLKKKEIKEDNYIEVEFNSNNSDLFDEQLKKNRICNGQIKKDDILNDGIKLPLNIVDTKEYKDSIYLNLLFEDDINNIDEIYYRYYPNGENKQYYMSDISQPHVFFKKEEADNIFDINGQQIEKEIINEVNQNGDVLYQCIGKIIHSEEYDDAIEVNIENNFEVGYYTTPGEYSVQLFLDKNSNLKININAIMKLKGKSEGDIKILNINISEKFSYEKDLSLWYDIETEKWYDEDESGWLENNYLEINIRPNNPKSTNTTHDVEIVLIWYKDESADLYFTQTYKYTFCDDVSLTSVIDFKISHFKINKINDSSLTAIAKFYSFVTEIEKIPLNLCSFQIENLKKQSENKNSYITLINEQKEEDNSINQIISPLDYDIGLNVEKEIEKNYIKFNLYCDFNESYNIKKYNSDFKIKWGTISETVIIKNEKSIYYNLSNKEELEIKPDNDYIYCDINDNEITIVVYISNEIIMERKFIYNYIDKTVTIQEGDFSGCLSTVFLLEEYYSLKLYNKKKQNLLSDLLLKLSNEQYPYYELVFKQREKIMWVTKEFGHNNNIYKIELENDLKANLNNSENIYVYSSSNKNTNYTFFGVKDSDLNVDNIYVRFPGYTGNDYNGNYIYDVLPYYNQVGKVDDVLILPDKSSISVDSKAVSGYFYQHYDENQSETVLQSIDIYGKNVNSSVFENHMSERNTYVWVSDELNDQDPATFNNFNGIEFHSDGYGYSDDAELDLTFFSEKNGKGEICKLSSHWLDYSITVTVEFLDNIQKHDGFLYGLVKITQVNSYDIKKQRLRWQDVYLTKDHDIFSDGVIVKMKSIHFDILNDKDQSKSYIALKNNDFKNIVYAPNNRGSFDEGDLKNDTGYDFNDLKFVSYMNGYSKLFKVTSYDYDTGEFVLAGGLERQITENDQYEVWEKTVSETSENEYNITEIKSKYTRLYPSHKEYDKIIFVGEDKAINNSIKIMNNTESQIFIQPNVNFYNNEYNNPYLLLDNNNERINLNYSIDKKDNGFTIEENNYDKLDGSQWLFNLKNETKKIPKSGQFYKLYMDTCGVSNQNWFYGRTIQNITIRVGEYNQINQLIKSNKIKINNFNDKKLNCIDIEQNKNGERCIVPYVDSYFMCTYDNLTVPIKRYRYILYDNFMKVVSDSGYIYDILTSYPIKGLRNEETYLLSYEMEDQLGYVYRKDISLIAKYNEYKIDEIMLKLECDSHQGCVMGTLVCEDTNLEIYNSEEINILNNFDISENNLNKNYRYCNKLDLKCIGSNDNIYVYRRNKEKLLHFVCTIDLNNPIITENNQEKFGFIDYGVVNNEYYDYVIILACDNPYIIENKNELFISDINYIYIEERCKTCFDGWILVDLEQDTQEENVYYVKDNVWNFKYNLESQDLTQNTSVKQWDTLGKYANVYVGKKNYISSGLSCLLGDVGYYESFDGKNVYKKYGYFEKDLNSINYDNGVVSSNESMNNNIDKYLQWKTFNSNGTPKLLKDYKGNMWIVQILEKPTTKNADNSNEQIYTISFNWVEIEDSKKYSFLGKESSVDNYSLIEQQIGDYWDYEFDKDNSLYLLKGLKKDYDYSVINDDNPIVVGGDINIGNTLVKGVLQTNYYTPPLPIYPGGPNGEELIVTKDMFMNIGDYEGELYIDFSSDLLIKDLKNIDSICKDLNYLQRVNINFTDNIEDASYAFANTDIRTDDKYQIQINTNNYINMKGIFEGVSSEISTTNPLVYITDKTQDILVPVEELNDKITIKWGLGATDPDIRTYHELYEQYWNCPHIVLDCKYTLNYNLDNGEINIKDWVANINDDENKEITLITYNGDMKKIYIPNQILIQKSIQELGKDYYKYDIYKVIYDPDYNI